MQDITNNRKIEHINAINKDPYIERNGNYFDNIQLSHRSLPQINFDEIDTSTQFLGKRIRFPLVISSMTGGDHHLLETINRNLAIAAEESGVALAVGSQRVMFSSKNSQSSFALRQYAPTTLLMSNIGAVQLNKGFDQSKIQQAIDTLGADALYLHLNPLQEAIQEEGDRNFSGLIEKIALLNRSLEIPLILKEVGCGISTHDIKACLPHGIRYFDIAGKGGTSWSRIEYNRCNDKSDSLGLLFQDWGIPTPIALKQAAELSDDLVLIASGGVRNGIDIIKSILLGASVCGLAAPFLQPAMQSPEAVLKVIEQLQRELKTAMFLLGAKNIAECFKNHTLMAS